MQIHDMRQIFEQNRQMLDIYPFLWPIDEDGNRIPLDAFQYSQTLVDRIPPGWARVFGHEFVQGMKRLCDSARVDYETCHFTHFKVGGGKWSLRFSEDAPGLEEFLDKMEYMSQRICAECGQSATRLEIGADLPICDKCAEIFSSRRNIPMNNRIFPKLEQETWLKEKGGVWYEFDGNNWNEYKTEESDEKAE